MYHTQREDGPVGDTLGAPARSSVIRISAPLPARRPEEVDGPHGVAELALPVDLVGGHGNLGQRQGGGGDGREAHIGWERDLHNFKRGRDCRCVCRGMIGCYPEWRDAALIWTQGGRWIRGEGILVDTRGAGRGGDPADPVAAKRRDGAESHRRTFSGVRGCGLHWPRTLPAAWLARRDVG